MYLLIGIDDTDNLDSRGTGHKARVLGRELVENGLAELLSVTRHQLFVDSRIPYTSHNSSACLLIDATTNVSEIIAYCSHYLQQNAEAGSDAGLCVAAPDRIDAELLAYGQRAKKEVIQREEAEHLARTHQISLSAHSGLGIGVIGSLAAVSLHAGGNDGRYLWLPGLRETPEGTYTIRELLERTGVDRCLTLDGTSPPPHETIAAGNWFRPVLVDHFSTLYVEEANEDERVAWKTVSKEIIKRY